MPADLTEARAPVDLRGARDVAATWSADDLAYARNTRPHRLTSEAVAMLALHDALAEVDRLTALVNEYRASLLEHNWPPEPAGADAARAEVEAIAGQLRTLTAERDAARAEGRREGRIAGLHEAAAEALMDHRHLHEDGDYSGCVVCSVSRDILALADGEVPRG